MMILRRRFCRILFILLYLRKEKYNNYFSGSREILLMIS
jgi:hypothetical protein